jgi:hypothetical protein
MRGCWNDGGGGARLDTFKGVQAFLTEQCAALVRVAALAPRGRYAETNAVQLAKLL